MVLRNLLAGRMVSTGSGMRTSKGCCSTRVGCMGSLGAEPVRVAAVDVRAEIALQPLAVAGRPRPRGLAYCGRSVELLHSASGSAWYLS
jgi:hypothetical protein